MALNKQIKVKGIDANYWVITGLNWNKASNKIAVDLRLYANQEARQESLENLLDNRSFLFDGNLTIAECYAKIKESKMEEVVTPEVMNEDGTITPEVKEEKESNFFVDAVDC